MPLNPEHTVVHLAEDGTGQALDSPTFWSLPPPVMDGYGSGWLVSEFVFTQDWANWEMHPHGDEFVYLLDGAVEFVLQQPSGLQTEALVGRGAVLVPRGVWHTARVRAPSRMLFVTRGRGTQHRPVDRGPGDA